MNDATLQAFRALADTMAGDGQTWEWVGPHMSQRMFGITQARAEAYAERHGGVARKMPKRCGLCGGVKPAGQSCGCFDNGGQ